MKRSNKATTKTRPSEVETCPNPEMRIYHSRRELAKVWYGRDRGGIPPFEKKDSDAAQLAAVLIALDGVDSVYVRPYFVQVQKARLFTWEDVEARVLEVLRPLMTEVEQAI